jgi:hypothetical protein
MIAHQKEEWRLPRGFAWPIVMRELRDREIRSPICLMMVGNKPDSGLDPLI